MMRLPILIVLMMLGLPASAATLIAHVDRTQLSLNETVELTLETADTNVFGKPDLQPLEGLFRVFGTRQLNQLSSAQGETRAVTKWLITLQPQQTGYVVIPPLQVGELRSEPITLHVESSSSNGKEALAPIFIDASIDQDNVYVQAQVLLTLRIYHSVSLYDDSTLSPLQMPDALVERLDEPRTYEKDINGIRHGVIEIRYALYPQKSGDLLIPSQLFSATAVAPATGDLYGSRFGRSTQVKSPSIPLHVKPKPVEYPADTPWLPAAQLTLVEAWSPEPDQIRLGEPLTRSLLLKAEGLTSAQLPPLLMQQVPDLRSYPDQPSLRNEAFTNGVHGSREERQALVASRTGRFVLPAVEVVWWNTHEDRLERTTLPARDLVVGENPELQVPEINVEPEAPLPAEGPLLWPWQLSTLLLALSTLLGFGLWLHARNQPAIVRPVHTGPLPRNLLEDLRRACQSGDPQATRHALDAWARQQPETLAQMAERYSPLSSALDRLNGALYSESESGKWQGDDLWQAIRGLPALSEAQEGSEPGTIPPLYPK